MLQPPSISSLIPQKHLLPNGQTLRYFPNNALGLVKLDITVEAGSRYQRFKCQAHAANQLFGEATAMRDAREVAEFLDFRGIVVERMADVCVSNLTFYFLRRYADELLPLVREMFDAPYSGDGGSPITQAMFDAYVAKRRQQLATGFQKTSYVARNRFYELLYGTKHPLGTYAKLEDIDALTLEAVNDFICERYALGTAHLVMSGDVDEELLALADRYLASQSLGGMSEPSLPQPNPESGEEDGLSRQRLLLRGVDVRPGYVSYQLPNAVQSTIRIGCILPFFQLDNQEIPMRQRPLLRGEADRLGFVSAINNSQFSQFMVLNTVLGGYFGSRLMSNIREDKGYTYGIYSTTQIHRGSIVFYITADVAKEATQSAVEEVFKEIDRLQQEPISAEELDRVRNYMMGDFIRSIDGVFEVSERYRQMASTHVVDPNPETDPLATSLLEAITQVTPAQLQSLAQTHLKDLITVTVG